MSHKDIMTEPVGREAVVVGNLGTSGRSMQEMLGKNIGTTGDSRAGMNTETNAVVAVTYAPTGKGGASIFGKVVSKPEVEQTLVAGNESGACSTGTGLGCGTKQQNDATEKKGGPHQQNVREEGPGL